jgi:hypothetical protein
MNPADPKRKPERQDSVREPQKISAERRNSVCEPASQAGERTVRPAFAIQPARKSINHSSEDELKTTLISV